MSGKLREKTYYRITFSNESTGDDELYQVCARHVSASDLYGLVEISGFIFPENKLVYNPGEERIKREFGEIKRSWIPYHAIIRIDELADTTASEIKIVSLDSARRAGERRAAKKQE